MRAVPTAEYRWSVLSRAVAASVGGYALVAALQLALTAALPWAFYKVLLFSSQTSYLYYTGIIIWCFAARTARRAWFGLALAALPLALIDAWYLLHRSAP
jgi:hypothetical protein